MSKENSSTKNDQNKEKTKQTGSTKEQNKSVNFEKELEKQANTIAKLENEIKNISDPNKEPRIIQKGKQRHPRYVSNNIKISSTIEKVKSK